MTSSDMAGETQPGFVFGNGEANLQRKHVPPDSTEPPLDEPTPTEMVNLRRCDLTCVPDRVLGSSDLTYLCLEGNQIPSVPASLFCSLPRLQWLDLRKNLITCLPPEIGSHRSLRNLLLEANPISELPAELGNVITLRGLSLRGCPIRFPPKEVLHQGCRSVLQYLRSVLARREVTERKSLPAEEQLRLSELTESSVEEQEESADEDGLQRFRELKDELISLEKAEVAAMAQSRRKSQLLPAAKRKGLTTKAGIMPELRLLGSQYCGRSGERGEPARREQREKQALLEKEKKGALQKHRKQAKTRGRQRKAQEAVSERPAEGSTGPSPERKREEDRSARELERHIRAHVKRMQERRGNPGGTMAPQTAVTEEDVEEIRKLQARLLERKNLGRPSENAFTIYTADTWPSFLFK